ncbi:MAG: DNA polymerase I [Candidatus Omnitrophica bacterium]|nr:DNA polymerase I [Candidatus Omnitrophota bacterium]
MSRSQLCLIDATAFSYRAFYALKGLSTSFGQPTNAVLGFVNFLNKILKQEKPEYVGACFDVSRDTFRQREFAEYKIQRPAMPDELSSQIPIIKEIIRAYGIPIFEKRGFEADDLIASLSRKAREEKLDVMIISSDKDIFQLVDEQVVVFSPYKDKGVVYDSGKIKEQFGIKPKQFVDFISLAGDPADNIPSVKGIGPKTASKLIKDFQSVEGIIDNLESIKPQRLHDAIEESVEQIRLNRRIARLRDDLELEFDLEDLKLKEPDYSLLHSIFRQLEFKRLLANLPFKNDAGNTELMQSKTISELKKSEELILLYRQEEVSFMDISAKAFKSSSFSALDKEAREILGNPSIKKTGHNLKNLKVELAKQGIKLEGLFFDTMIAAYLLNSSSPSYDLPDLAWDYLKEVFDNQNLSQDTACLLIARLKNILEKELKDKELNSLFFNLEMPLVEVLADMEIAGVALDLELLKSLASEVEAKLIGLVDEIYKLSGCQFNINSPKQLRSILFEKLKLPARKKTKSGPSTDEEVLRMLAQFHPLPEILLQYRKLTKIKSTYIDAFPVLVDSRTKRIHACFNQTGTQTGRLSSTSPNLQNLPIKTEIGRRIRKAVISAGKDYCLLSSDYSQIELRILAHLSQDAALILAFGNNEDIHLSTASLIYGLEQNEVDDKMRETAKRINFGIVYGLSSFGLSRDLDISQAEASAFIDMYFLRYPMVKDYIQEQIERARKDGYVTTILGRRRYIPQINSKNAGIRQFSERQAVNTPIQGSAADLIKKAMLEIHSKITKLGLKSRLILQIHDELVFDVFEAELKSIIELVRHKMETCFSLSVPVKVVLKQGRNWMEMKEV